MLFIVILRRFNQLDPFWHQHSNVGWADRLFVSHGLFIIHLLVKLISPPVFPKLYNIELQSSTARKPSLQWTCHVSTTRELARRPWELWLSTRPRTPWPGTLRVMSQLPEFNVGGGGSPKKIVCWEQYLLYEVSIPFQPYSISPTPFQPYSISSIPFQPYSISSVNPFIGWPLPSFSLCQGLLFQGATKVGRVLQSHSLDTSFHKQFPE